MSQPDDVERLSADLRALYAGVWARIELEQERLLQAWPSLTRTARLTRLRDLQDLVTELRGSVDEQALRWVVTDLPRAFLTGALDMTAGASTGLSYDALGTLAADTYADLLEATSGVDRTTKTLIRTLGKEHAADQLVRGKTATQAGRDLAEQLTGRGVTAVTYANGARHGLGDYSDMLLRTKSALAYNEGGFVSLARSSIDWVEVFDGGSCGWTSHADSDKPNGTVRPLAAAKAHPIAHPRCRRSFGGRPDVSSARQAERAGPSTTAAQRVDQAAVERSAELVVARRAVAKALAGRVDRTAARLLDEAGGRIVSPAYAQRVASRQVRLDRDRRAAARATRLAARRP